MANNNDKDIDEEDIEVLPALTKSQKRAKKKLQATKDHDYQVANIATSASKIVGAKTNSFGSFAAYVGVHAVDFLLGDSDFSDNSKKKKKKKKKNKKKFYDDGKKRHDN